MMRSFVKTIALALLFMATGTAAARAQTPQPASEQFRTSIVEEIALWPGTAPGSQNAPASEKDTGSVGDRFISAIAHPTITAFYASNPNGAAIVVMPGGGYVGLAFDKQGTEIARWLNTLGVDAFVLKYRLPGEGHNPGRDVALQDAQRALRLVRAGDIAERVGHHIDPKRVGVIGFSAGGNLAAMLSTYHDSKVYDPIDAADALSARPDFMILGYAWVPINGEIPASMEFPAAHLFADKASAQTPPAFVFAGDKDEEVSYTQSERVAQILQKAGVPVELRIFHGAPHGFGLRGKGEEKAWPELCAAWLERQGVIPSTIK